MYNISQKYFSRILFFTKIVIIAAAYYIISEKVMGEGNLNAFLWIDQVASSSIASYSFLSLLLFLSLLNWILEILKWQSLVSFVQNISFYKAAKQSLSSLTASLMTPNRIGEYGAKAVYYPKSQRSMILLLNFLGNFSQMSITLLFGLIGFTILWDTIPSGEFQFGSLDGLSIVLILVLGIAVLLKKKLIPILRALKKQCRIIPSMVHKRTFIYAFLRYLVFSHQFYLFLLLFGVQIEYSTAMPIIYSMYFISSIIPGFVMFDWLVKGSVAVSLFGLFGVSEIVVLSITGLMWVLNFAIPSMIGTVYVLTFKGSSLVYRESRVFK